MADQAPADPPLSKNALKKLERQRRNAAKKAAKAQAQAGGAVGSSVGSPARG